MNQFELLETFLQLVGAIFVFNLLALVYRLVAIIDAYRVTEYLNAYAASGDGRLGPARLPRNPLSIAGLAAKSTDGAGGFAYPLIFLPFLSSAFVPTDGMPGPVRAFAENQPVTSIVDTLRNLYAEQPLGHGGWLALGWCLGLLVVAYGLAMSAYRHKVA